MKWLYRFFSLKENGTTIRFEFIAGLTTFLAMLYIIPVSSQILSIAGMPKNELLTAVTLITIISTFICGIYAKTPVAMSVGMGLNAYFAYGLVGGMGLSWQQALGAVFLSGVIFMIISVTKIRTFILQSIPKDLRFALCAGLGTFIGTLGLKSLGIVGVSIDGTLLIGDIANPTTLLGMLGVCLMAVFYLLRLQGAIILGILVVAILGWVLGFSPLPSEIISSPSSLNSIAFSLDLSGMFELAMIPAILSLLIADLFDSVGTLAGIGAKTKMFDTKAGKKKLEKTLQVDALATMGGAILGTSTTTSFLESSAGVSAGGRTGLTAIFVALFFSATLFFLPIFNAIPSFAIFPALIIVGALMFSEVGNIDFSDFPTSLATFVTILLMPLTSSITYGFCGGFVMYVIGVLVLLDFKRLGAGVWLLFAMSLIPFLIKILE